MTLQVPWKKHLEKLTDTLKKEKNSIQKLKASNPFIIKNQSESNFSSKIEQKKTICWKVCYQLKINYYHSMKRKWTME